jgi:pimeloyl-ACP methyl ester carboxylesterase
MTGDYSMPEIAADALALADELGLDRFHLVGHSMGGMATQRVLVDIDDRARVKSAVVVDPVPACGAQLEGDNWALFSGAIENDENRYNILDFTTGNRNTPQWINYMVARSRSTTTDEAFAGYLNAWAKEDFSEQIKGFKTPVLVCIGEHDHAFSSEVMKNTYLAWLPNAQLEVIANAGHYPMQEAPINLVCVIERYMHKHS